VGEAGIFIFGFAMSLACVVLNEVRALLLCVCNSRLLMVFVF
jgi:hypothetical protein